LRHYTDDKRQAQIWYPEEEIEAAVEQAMRAAGCLLSAASPSPDLELFVEQGLEVVLDQSAPLPLDVLGVTRFRVGERPRIEINAYLTGAFDGPAATMTDTARWRSTLAHEAAHVILHSRLFQLDDQQLKLPLPTESESLAVEVQSCLKRDVRFGGQGQDPREFQANRGMAALLMPRKLFADAARRAAQTAGLPEGILSPMASGSGRLVAMLAEQFQVSRQATGIRLGQLGSFTPTQGLACSSVNKTAYAAYTANSQQGSEATCRPLTSPETSSPVMARWNAPSSMERAIK